MLKKFVCIPLQPIYSKNIYLQNDQGFYPYLIGNVTYTGDRGTWKNSSQVKRQVNCLPNLA